MKKLFIILFLSFFTSFIAAQELVSPNFIQRNGVVLNNKVYFVMNSSTTGVELFESDGTTAGTVLVKDIYVGATSANIGELTLFNNKIYFSADDGVHGIELWESDGTTAGTVLLKDIWTGNQFTSSGPSNLTVYNNKIYFSAFANTSQGRELWETDGTSAGTKLVKDINPSGNSNLSSLTVFSNKLYFNANGGTNGIGLWESDGTSAGTILKIPNSVVSMSIIDGSDFPIFNNKMYFEGSVSGGDRELWATDGTSAGTQLVKDINTTGFSNVRNFSVFNNMLYFFADDGVNGSELWKSDGTTSGTQLFLDINSGANSSFPSYLTVFNNRIYFSAIDATNGQELWETQGTAETTKLVLDIQAGADNGGPSFLTPFNNSLFFNANDGTNFGVFKYTPPIEITSTLPSINSTNIAVDSNIQITFTTPAVAANVNANNIIITGSKTGSIAGTFSGADTNTITFNPTNNFKTGEEITVTLTIGISIPYTFKFTVEVPVLAAPFQSTDTPIELSRSVGVSATRKIVSGDLNGDRAIDIIVFDNGRMYWFLSSGGNNPTYTSYTLNSSAFSNFDSFFIHVKLIDVNKDGFLDIVTSNISQITWLENNGNAVTGFTEHIIANNTDGANMMDAADMDNDGDIDIVHIKDGEEITLHKNNGASTPTFTSQVIIDGTSFLNANTNLIVTDLNKDGNIDVLYPSINLSAASGSMWELIWLKNNGESNPTFTRTIIENTIRSFQKLVVTDINGDGDLDIATYGLTGTGGSFDTNFVWLENNGGNTPTFAKNDLLTLNSITFGIDFKAADIDGDDDMDFVLINDNNNLSWLENDGNAEPTFTPNTISSNENYHFTVGDVDNDGDTDIVALNRDPNDGVYLYETQTSISLITSLPVANSNNVLQESNIVLNFSDAIFASNVNTNNIKISGAQTGTIVGTLTGAGTNQITFNPTNNFKPGETITVTITDKIISNPTTFSFTAKVPFKVTPFQPTDTPLEIATLTDQIIGTETILTGDLNNDGFLDVVALDEFKVNWLISSGGANPTYTKYESAATTATEKIRSIKLADINNDGFLDIVTANFQQTVWFQNNGNATTSFTEILVANTGTSTGLKLVEVSDLDQDGAMDVVQIDRNGVVTWYRNNGATTPVFTPQLIFDDPNRLLADFNDLVAKDMDNDGDVDLVFNSFLSTNREIILLENNGTTNPTFTRKVIRTYNTGNPLANLLVSDINGDGFLDVAFTEKTASGTTYFFVWLENNGAGNPLTFTERNDANLTQSFYNLYATADIDGDGDTDFFTIDSNAPNSLIYLENNSTTNPVSFTKVALQNVVGIAANATFGDTDNDGSLDIITLDNNQKVRIFKGSKALNTFLGTTNNLWSTLNNWSFGTLPRPTEEIKIQTATTANLDIAAIVDKITIDGTLHINAGKSLTVTGDVVQNGTFSIQSDATSSGSFMASGTYSGAGKIDYYRYVTDNWHLISVPVDFVLAGNFATNSANNLDSKLESAGGPSYTKYALAPYENNLGNGLRYKYYTDFNGPNDISIIGPFQRARGYSARRKTAGTYTFTGGFFSDNAIFALDDSSSSGGTKWNLLGNPYTSFVALNMEARLGDNFLTVNGANLDPARVAIYLWNANTSSYDIINHATGVAKYAAPGQGFFVQAKDGASTLATFTPVMQSVQAGDFFSKSANNIPEIQVSITTGKETKTTEIKYFENATTGLDAGLDAGVFSESSDLLAIYTQLITNNTGIDFALQCLPNKDVETMIIPLGINAKANTPFTISAKSFNLNEGLNVYLEDRENNIFTNLSEADFSSTTKTDLKGVGRFFLHTSSKVLSTDTVILNKNISIYKKDNNTLTIVGLNESDANLQLFDILGKSVFTTNLNGTGKNDVSIPNLKLGVYLVSIKTQTRNINKKIILE